jgi:phosphoribosyl 1,2-cyclic phosphodiesterase
MRFASLGSGSRGNATLIQTDTTLVMLDCGFSMKEAIRRMALLGVTPEDLDALIVTHEHGDHIKGIGPFSRKHKLPVYLTQGTLAYEKLGVLHDARIVKSGEVIHINDLDVMPIAVNHDAREPVQYKFRSNELLFGVITDLGSYGDELEAHFSGCHGLMLEANHDLDMLMYGDDPYALKLRVSGDEGHLNNDQTIALLAQLDCSVLQTLVLVHLSERNNTPKKVAKALSFSDFSSDIDVLIASQCDGIHWQTLL